MSILLRKQPKMMTQIIHALLYFCLKWIRDNELDCEELTIILKTKHAPTFIKGQKSVIWQPGLIEHRTLKISEWTDFETPQLINLKKLKKLFNKNLPECEIEFKYSEEKVPVLQILWPADMIFEVDKDIELSTKKKGIASTHTILTLLTYQPNWITSGQCKRGEAFYKKIAMGFKKIEYIIYEGAGASYIMNEKGLGYIHTRKLEDLMKSQDLKAMIKHDEGYETWKREVTNYIERK